MAKQRLAYLDTLRGIASLSIVFAHLFDMYVKHNLSGLVFPTATSITESVEIGRVGVLTFFLLSGFLLPVSFIGKESIKGYTRQFVIKVFFRLYPVFWFSILLVVLFTYRPALNVQSFEQVIVNLTMIPKFLGVNSVNGAYWTLHLTIGFYIICLALFAVRRIDHVWTLIICMLGLGIGGIFFGWVKFHFGTKILPVVFFYGLGMMILGALIRMHMLDSQKLSLKLLSLCIAMYFICVAGGHAFYYEGIGRFYLSYVLAVAIFCLWISFIKWHTPVLDYFGRISYSTYLVHWVVLGAVFHHMGESAYHGWGIVIAVLLSFGGSILLADLAYRLIEKGGIKLHRSLYSK